jgi:MoaA/NifB/PqqE/SkfB family radical SAM enzyme
MCNISRSTGWIKDHKAMKDFLNDSGDQDFDQFDSKSYPFKTDFEETKQQLPISFIDDNWEHFLNANLIDLSGGEPFYMPQAIYLLEKLADSDYNGKLKIITNASLIEPYIDLLSNFNCQLVISCDGIDELYPIMRPTTSKKVLTWEHFESIMRKLKDNKINHGHSFVPQLANIHHLERWLDWCRDFYSDRKTNAIALPLYRSNWMRIEHYPDEEFKHNLADRLEKRNDILEFDNFNIEATIGQLRMKGDPVQYERFLAYMAKLDEIRNTNFMAIWAENT